MKRLLVRSSHIVLLTFALLAAWTASVAAQPANDNFANAAVLSGAAGVTNGTNVGATNETGEPPHANTGSLSVWYSWTPLQAGQATFDTSGSNFDTVIGIYTGTAVDALTGVASDDDSGDGTTSRASFQAALGTTYRIAVAGYSGATGSIVLTWSSPVPIPTPIAADFTVGGGNAQGWLGGPFPGFGGSTSLGGSGLCMAVPGPGDNVVGWVSPERFVPLIDNVVYRVRVTASTDQTATNAIPLWFIIYDNFNAGGGGNNFGGSFWFLDVDGGAEGVGRAGGRTQFDAYLTPNAVATAQWRAGAFTPAADALNDIRLQVRVIDANATLLTDQDSGSICIQNIEIQGIPRDILLPDVPVFNPPIAAATHFAEAVGEIGVGGTAQIDDTAHTARYQLSATGDNRKTLGPFDPTKANLNQQLYPVIWEGNTLYRVRARIRAESSEADPIESIFLAADTTTNELGTVQYSTRANPGGAMDRAASPKLVAADYESYFYSQNATLSATPDANRFRPLAFFFNSTSLFGDGTGADAFIVEALSVDKMLPPPTFAQPTFAGELAIGPGTIFSGESTDLTFAAALSNAALATSLDLIETDAQGVGSTVIGSLLDDGNLSTGDDIAGDGVFHAKMTTNPSSLIDRYFVAQIPGTALRTAPARLVIVDHLSDSDFNAILAFNATMATTYSDGITAGKTIAQINQMLLDQLTAHPADAILSGPSDNGEGVWWVSPTGILSLIGEGGRLGQKAASAPSRPTWIAPPRTESIQPQLKKQPILMPRLFPAEERSTHAVTDQTIIVDSNKALVLSPFNFQFGANDEYDLKDKLIAANFDVYGAVNAVDGDQNVLIDYFKNLDTYGVVIVSSHGDSYYNGLLTLWEARFGEKIPFWASPFAQVIINTGVNITVANKATYEADLKAQRIALNAFGTRYVILPSFIRTYSGNFPKSFVYITACRSSFNSTMADAFTSKGAKAYFGYSDYVGSDFARMHGTTMLDELIQGMETGQVMGVGDIETDADPARFDRFGDDHLVIVGGLRNGTFEIGSLAGWTTVGDARVITGLGPLSPPEGSRMVIVSTGLGSDSDSDSSISQKFVVPVTATALKFRYDVISEEPLEFVGSQFDDQFEVTLGPAGTPTTVVTETVNSSAWFPIGGINFAGGDDTVFHTGWKNVTVDLTPYRGMVVTLNVHTFDRGDSIYDTAAVCDNFVVEVAAAGGPVAAK